MPKPVTFVWIIKFGALGWLFEFVTVTWIVDFVMTTRFVVSVTCIWIIKFWTLRWLFEVVTFKWLIKLVKLRDLDLLWIVSIYMIYRVRDMKMLSWGDSFECLKLRWLNEFVTSTWRIEFVAWLMEVVILVCWHIRTHTRTHTLAHTYTHIHTRAH